MSVLDIQKIRNANGSITLVTDVRYRGETWAFTQTYYGYSKSQAVRLFLEQIERLGYEMVN